MNGLSLTPETEKIKALQEILPEVFTEGKVDWEKLKATLGEDINFSNERYVLNWAGKSDAFKVLQTPSNKTLVPVREESVNFDETENIFIEGENLEVLKVLQKSYFGKVKMIYIDPPYNTGNDSFIYPDKFSETKDEYQRRVGDKDEEGYMTKDGMFRKNSKENGQYHSNWLNMMMPRLYLAKNLLRQDGVIFISIDDNEVHNLRLLMNEIFGEENFIAQIIWKKKQGGGNDSSHFVVEHEYVLLFAKNISFSKIKNNKDLVDHASYPFEDENGNYNLVTLDKSSIQFSKSLVYEIVGPDGKKYLPRVIEGKQACWRWSKEKVENEYDTLVFKNDKVYTKFYIPEGYKNRTLWVDAIYGRTGHGKKQIKQLFDKEHFDYPKPVELIKNIVKISSEESDTILDFFAGSGTTAQAIYELNKEDRAKRKFICVQLPELCEENSDAVKAGYKTIADISKERVRRAAQKVNKEIKEEIQKLQTEQAALKSEIPTEETLQKISKIQTDIELLKNQDLGIKILKIEDSNFKQWQQIEGKNLDALAEQMKLFVDPVSESATIENMVYELMLKSGKDLNSKIEKQDGFFSVNAGELVLMLEKANQEIIHNIIALNPQKVIALDKLFTGNDQLKTNTVLQMKDAGIEFKTI